MEIINHIELAGIPLKNLNVGDTFTKNGLLYVLNHDRVSIVVEDGGSCSFDGAILVTPVKVELHIYPVKPETSAPYEAKDIEAQVPAVPWLGVPEY